MLADLLQPIDRHLDLVEAVETTNTPNGQHTVTEYRLRIVFGVILDNQLRSLRAIRGLCDILVGDKVSP